MLPTRRMRVFACKRPTDMRGSLDSLYRRTKEIIDQDPKYSPLLQLAAIGCVNTARTMTSVREER